MNSDTTRGDQVLVLTSRVPRWLHALALVPMGVLLTLVLALVLGYLTAGPVDNLAGALLIYAAFVAVPLLASLLAWATGRALQDRSPGLALALVVVSACIGGFAVLLLAASFLMSLGG